MSLAREPGRGSVSSAAGRRSRFLGIPALTLAAVLTFAATMWLATRRPASVAQGVGAARTSAGHAGPGHARAHNARPAAVVQIVERPRPRRVVRPKPAPRPPELEASVTDPVPTEPPAEVESPKPVAPAHRLPKELHEASAVPDALALPPAPAKKSAAASSHEKKESKAITPPEPEERPEARYPEDAAAEGVTGAVRLKVVVGRGGQVADAQVMRSSGDNRLDRAAESAVRRWRYRPAHVEGRNVPAVDYVEVEFYRDDQEKSEKK
jgi:periplasmic protein TonB